MRTLLLSSSSFILVAIILSVVSCDAPTDLNPPGKNFAGFIYFVDTCFTHTNGYYAISIYNDSIDLSNKVPMKNDSLCEIKFNGTYSVARYKMYDIPDGKFCIASTWVKYPHEESDTPLILGIYGCDTNFNSCNPRKLVFPNFTGNYVNIYSYADTSKGIH